MLIFKITGISLIALSFFSGIYSYSVPKLSGSDQSLASFQNKKMMLITLPVAQNPAADSMLVSLDSIATLHADSITIIGVPAYEDGYLPASKETLQQWYTSRLGNHVLITDGLYTRKTSGAQQHNIFKWLTSSNLNNVFDIDVEGVGHKFFINRDGELYGVLRPQTRLTRPVIHELIMQ